MGKKRTLCVQTRKSMRRARNSASLGRERAVLKVPASADRMTALSNEALLRRLRAASIEGRA